jgi:hypothetical protein
MADMIDNRVVSRPKKRRHETPIQRVETGTSR